MPVQTRSMRKRELQRDQGISVIKGNINVDRECQYKYTHALMMICLLTISCASLYKYQLSSKITANEENLQITTRKQDAHLLLDQSSLPLMKHDHAMSTTEDEVLKKQMQC